MSVAELSKHTAKGLLPSTIARSHAPRGLNAGTENAESAGGWEHAVALGDDDARSRELRAALDRRDAQTRLLEGVRARVSRGPRSSRRVSLTARKSGDEDLRVLFSRDGVAAYERRLSQISIQDLVHGRPMRTFSRRNAQSNKPAAHYSRTTADLVGCESQHERRFVTLADFSASVVHIAAQPFTIEFPPGCEVTSHTPDFVLLGAYGAIVVVDVKWPSKALDERAVRRHAIVKKALAAAGIAHFVWTGTPLVVTENLANFAAARVPERMMLDLAPKLLSAHTPGMSVRGLRESAAQFRGVDPTVGLVVLRRMLWEQQLKTDIFQRFSPDSELTRP